MSDFLTILFWIAAGLGFIALVSWTVVLATELGSWLLGFLAIALFALGLAFVIWAGIKAEEEDRDACEDAGGRYVVVDEQLVYTGKIWITRDVHGCVWVER